MAARRLLLMLGFCFSAPVPDASCSSALSVERRVPKTQEPPRNLTHLDLSNSNISELDQTSLLHLEDLQVLILRNQSTGLVIRNDTFRTLSKLWALKLDYNQLLTLDAGAFHGLSGLEILTLSQCGLDDSVLTTDLLKPLVSLQTLVLKDNKIQRIRPAPFFSSMSRFHTLDLSYNGVKSVCEEDLLGFQGKRFTLLKLSSVTLRDMTETWSRWNHCGNPFKNMSVVVLDLSGNSFTADAAKRFFESVAGTEIHSLVLRNSYNMGSSYGHHNLKDPDTLTFAGLRDSGIRSLDLSSSKIFALAPSLFWSVCGLRQLTLAENQINKIENDAFLGLMNLQKLNLSKNFLGSIDSRSFRHLERLELLDLSYNHIWILGQNSFLGLPNLAELNLTGNVLKSIYRFATLPNLKKFYLGDNKIEQMTDVLDIAEGLTTLHLDFNKLNALSDFYTLLLKLPELEEIVLQGNALLYCPPGGDRAPSHNLHILDLGLVGLEVLWSQGKCLDVFHNLQQLQQLSLSTNNLQSLPTDVFRDLTSLVFLDLSFNHLKYIPKHTLPESLRVLNLEYNSIYSVDPHLLASLSSISLTSNKFRCDCNLKAFQTWLNRTVILVHPAEEVTCSSPEDQNTLPVLSSSLQCEDEEEERRAEGLRLALFISCGALTASTLVASLLYARLRGHVFRLYRRLVRRVTEGRCPAPPAQRFFYDVYLCFSSRDMKWVERALLKRLDSQFSEKNPLRCCFEERDFLPGEDHLTNMRQAVQSSRKTLCVVSEHFLRDGWCLESFTLARCRALLELKDVLLVLLVGNIPQYRLLKHTQVRSYIENRRFLLWPEDSQDLDWFYHRLLKEITQDVQMKRQRDPGPADGQADTAL